MNRLAAIAVGLALLLYLRSPIDLLPDRLGAVGLLDDVLVILAAIWWLRRRLARAEAERSRTSAADTEDATENAAWDPHAVLGVTRGASADEITRAYREQMRLYHPDRVAHLGEELRQLAHRKALEIQRAYAEIGRP
jgi:DnaJ like chaperone protein